MCGRFEIHSAVKIIAEIFGISVWDIAYPANYNIAPGQDILIVTQNGKRNLLKSRWGFVPSWSKDLHTAYRMINARAETVAKSRAFGSAFEKHRCLVVADGFYEWKKEGNAKKPFYIRMKSGKPIGFAGLYNVWTSPDGEEINTSTIITTDANELISHIHIRMPVIVPEDAFDLWLDQKVQDPSNLQKILHPFTAKDLEMYPVSPQMNSVKYNAPDNIRPV